MNILYWVAARHSKTGQTDGAPQLVHLSGDGETLRQESLHTAGAHTDQAVGAGCQGITQGIQATAGDDNRRGGGESTDRLSPPPTQILEEDEGLVYRSGGSRPAARLGHT